MMLGFFGTSIAQDAVKEELVLSADQQQAVDEVIAMDPKLSAEEIEQLKIAVLGAPTKAEELIDPKLETQPEVVLAPTNADPIEEREIVLFQPVSTTSLTTIQTGTQPELTQKVEAINYRSLKGSSTQPQSASTAVKKTNYRSIKGPSTQPSSTPDDN